MGTSTSPVLLIFPTRENILVPFDFSVPIGENHSAPLAMILGTVAQVSDVIDIGRFAPQAALGRERRPGPGFTDLIFEGGDQGCFFTADKGPGP